MHPLSNTARKSIGYWLILGCVLIFVQVIIGGVTRLTGSGLSITEWKPLVGAIPPVSEAQWLGRFEEYKQVVQFKHLNEDMTLSEFKSIFFWEYFHRLWARFMSIAFLVPFCIFLYKKWIDSDLMKRLGVILIWGGVVGLYGWIMVKNGLTGLYVPPVFLSIHLILALSLFAYLVYMATYVLRGRSFPGVISDSKKQILLLGCLVLILLFSQLILGGIVSGMKAGLAYPTWPTMNGEWIPNALFQSSPTLSGILHYDPTDFWGRTMIQLAHRTVAYTLIALIVFYFLKLRKIKMDSAFQIGVVLLPACVLLQALIGILTVVHCTGSIPVSWGVLHQAGAMLLLADVVFVSAHALKK